MRMSAVGKTLLHKRVHSIRNAPASIAIRGEKPLAFILSRLASMLGHPRVSRTTAFAARGISQPIRLTKDSSTLDTSKAGCAEGEPSTALNQGRVKPLVSIDDGYLAEALLHNGPAPLPVDLINARDRIDHLVDAVANEPSGSVLDHLRHRSAA